MGMWMSFLLDKSCFIFFKGITSIISSIFFNKLRLLVIKRRLSFLEWRSKFTCLPNTQLERSRFQAFHWLVQNYAKLFWINFLPMINYTSFFPIYLSKLNFWFLTNHFLFKFGDFERCLKWLFIRRFQKQIYLFQANLHSNHMLDFTFKVYHSSSLILLEKVSQVNLIRLWT